MTFNFPKKAVLIGDRYQILEKLGQGGMGQTFLAIDTDAGDRCCVVKEFFPQTANQSSWQKCRELFAREAAILAKLEHPQIPQFFAWIEEQKRLFLVQEYIAGKTYWQLLQQQEKGFAEAEVRQWFKDLLPVIQFLHQKDVIHRDIAPDNIMRRNDGKPILIDFGAVKEVIHGSQQSTIGTRITKSGYSAPEQFRGKISAKSDIYSLAVTAVVLLTGKEPQELIDSETNEWQWQHYTNVSSDLARILNRMLQEQPKNRYQSAAEILRDLSVPEPTLLAETASTKLQLPQTEINSQLPAKQSLSIRRAIAFTAASCLVTGVGAGIWIATPHIPLLCQQFDNCAKDREFQSRYQQSQQAGDSAIAAAKQADNIQDLQTAQERLKPPIADLAAFPKDIKVFNESQRTLKEYRQQFQAIAARIAQEQEAIKQFEGVNSLQAEAINSTQAAKTISQHQAAKAKWQAVQQQLQAIPAGVFFSDRRKTALNESQQQQQAIQAEINQLFAAAAARQRQEAAARKVEAARQQRSPKMAASTPSKSTRISPKKPSNSSTSKRNSAPANPLPSRRKSTVPSRTSPKVVKPWWGSGSSSPANSPPRRRIW